MLLPVLFAWALVVQAQVHLCQEGVCQPHPTLQERSQVVRTLATESECLLAQMDLQRAYDQHQRRLTPPRPQGRQLTMTRTVVCHPN